MEFIEAARKLIDDLYHKKGFKTEDGRFPYDLVQYEVSCVRVTPAHPERFLITVQFSGSNAVLLSYGFEGSTYRDAVLFTDKPRPEKSLCKVCLMRHHAEDKDHSWPAQVNHCTPEELGQLIFAEVDRLSEGVFEEKSKLNFAEVRGILDGTIAAWQSRIDLCRDGDNPHHQYDCSDCYEVTLRAGLIAPEQYQIDIKAFVDDMTAHAWRDAAGWRIDCYFAAERGDYRLFRFVGDYEAEKVQAPTIAPTLIEVQSAVFSLAILPSYFLDDFQVITPQ